MVPLNIYKPINNPQHISILLPTRGRPEYLTNVFGSIEETTKDKNSIDVWVYVDDDDVITRKYINDDLFGNYGFEITWFLGKRTRTMGEMMNTLRQKCTTNPGIYTPIPDDYLFITEHWDDIVREAFNSYPDRIALAYAEDPMAGPNQVTFAWVSAEWANVLGRYHTEFFPFWYDDSWLDQVAQMAQRKVKLDIRMEPQGGKGKTNRMRNLLFWQKFFNNTLDDRIQDAKLLVEAIYQKTSYDYEKNVEVAIKLAKSFEAKAKEIRFEIRMERILSAIPKNSKPDEAYLFLEAKAVNHLWKKVNPLIKQGQIIKVLNILDNILCGYQYFKDVQYQRAILQETFRLIWYHLRNKPVRHWPGTLWSLWTGRQRRRSTRVASNQGTNSR